MVRQCGECCCIYLTGKKCPKSQINIMDLRSKSEYFDKNMVVHLMSAFGILYIFQII